MAELCLEHLDASFEVPSESLFGLAFGVGEEIISLFRSEASVQSRGDKTLYGCGLGRRPLRTSAVDDRCEPGQRRAAKNSLARVRGRCSRSVRDCGVRDKTTELRAYRPIVDATFLEGSDVARKLKEHWGLGCPDLGKAYSVMRGDAFEGVVGARVLAYDLAGVVTYERESEVLCGVAHCAECGGLAFDTASGSQCCVGLGISGVANNSQRLHSAVLGLASFVGGDAKDFVFGGKGLGHFQVLFVERFIPLKRLCAILTEKKSEKMRCCDICSNVGAA